MSITWSPGMTLSSMEKMIILEAFKFFRFNKTATSSSLGIAIRTLDNKLDQYNQEAEIEKQRSEEYERNRSELLKRARGNPPNNIGIPYTPTNSTHEDAFSRHFPSTPTGPRMESFANSSEKQAMPMSERNEVQSMLPENTSKSSKGKGR